MCMLRDRNTFAQARALADKFMVDGVSLQKLMHVYFVYIIIIHWMA